MPTSPRFTPRTTLPYCIIQMNDAPRFCIRLQAKVSSPTRFSVAGGGAGRAPPTTLITQQTKNAAVGTSARPIHRYCCLFFDCNKTRSRRENHVRVRTASASARATTASTVKFETRSNHTGWLPLSLHPSLAHLPTQHVAELHQSPPCVISSPTKVSE